VTGRVYLVGAGPGDPGLLTVRAAQILSEAEVVMVGDPLSEALLSEVAPKAQVIRGSEAKDVIPLAEEGKSVAWLLPGDPFAEARGAEMALALAEAGIPFEVVPGVPQTIGTATCAGIPLAKDADMAVLVNDLGVLEGEVRALLEAGCVPETAAALVERGATPEQRTTVGALSSIGEQARTLEVIFPALLVVGEAVGLRDRLNWFESRPLFGRRVLVTRARHQASALADRLARMGARVVALPTIEVVPPVSWGPLDQAIGELARYEQVVFTSVNGVRFFWERLGHAGGDARRLGHLRVAAIGTATAQALAERGVRADLVAKEFKAEGLSQEMVRAGVKGAHILVARAAEAREVLPLELSRAGATVDVVAAYQSVLPPDAADEAKRVLAGARLDALTFTSASTVHNFVQVCGEAEARRLGREAVVACIGPITRDAAATHGIPCQVMPVSYTIPALCEALARHFAGQRDSER
jgi:uroporphyrinogen III methyltransferase/synthase